MTTDQADPHKCLRLPSQRGCLYISCPGGGGAQANTGKTDVQEPVTVYVIGDSRPLVAVPGVSLPTANDAWTKSRFTHDERVLFVPNAKLIATLPFSNDRLILYHFDVDDLLQKSGTDFLYVVSAPPTAAARGTSFDYTPAIKSKRGQVKVKVESGPVGMTIGVQSTVHWKIPANFDRDQISVVLNVSDASGQSILNSFRLRIDPPSATPGPR